MNPPRVADTQPAILPLKAGIYSWCSCGHSETEPFCDGKHIGKGFCPKTFSLKSAQTVALCLCKHSQNPPYCDGSHGCLSGSV
ncbi:MAG: CDGSH iron-sulfur domain-containing protein [Cyanobacteria bacterium]|nr:CDGSH iron-sulfur domain-containing protein [Cyanobacteriota bacterium]